MTTDELIEKYAEHLRALNRSPKNIRTHARRVRRFFEFAAGRGVHEPADVTAALVLDYQKHVSNEINPRGTISTASTQNQHIAVLAVFFRYLRQAEYAIHDPTREIQYAKVPQRLPRAIMTLQEVKKLLRQPDVNTVLGYRDRAIMEVLYSTGVRRNELLSLRVEDVNLEGGFVMVRQGKGLKDRVVPLGTIAARYLETYLNGIRPELLKRGSDPATAALIVSGRGRVLSRNTLAAMVEKYARLAGIKHPVTPHTFRHTCATHMIRNRAGIRHVQEMLGHTNLATTQKYLSLTITDLKEAHSRFHPREKDR